MFTTGDYGQFELRDGRLLKIKMAKVAQIGELTTFFRTVAAKIPDSDFGTLLEIVAEVQTNALRQAKGGAFLDPRQLSVEALAGAALGIKPGVDIPDYRDVVKRGANVGGILIGILGAILAEVAVFAACFTNLSKEEFLELDIDEGALALAAVFMGNYSFFSQTLPPIFRALVAAQAARLRASQPVS